LPDHTGRARRRPLAGSARLAAGLLGAILLATLAAPLLAPRPFDAADLLHRLEPPGPTFWLGSDSLGRDIWSRLLYGGRVSLLAGIAAVLLAATIGTTLGLTSGYFGGWWDALLMRIVDVWLAVPYVLLALAIAVVVGPGLGTLVVVLALGTWPTVARVVRSDILSLRAGDLVLAARALGASETRILLRHLLPNVAGTLAVTLSLLVASTLLFEASLSFLGLGVQRPTPSWGTMLLDGVDVLGTAWWVAFFPGLAVLLTALALNVLGDWLRDALDPRRARSVLAESEPQLTVRGVEPRVSGVQR
jgi:peptide/nickel transport system permease protein